MMSILHPYRRPEKEPWLTRRVPIGVVAALIAFFTVFPLTAQLQQSGGSGGTNPSVGTYPAAAPGSATLTGGQFNTTPPTLTSGQMGAVQLDSSGNVLAKINAALPTGSNTIGAISNTGFSVTGSLPTGSNAIGTVRLEPLTSCGTTIADSGITALPASSTVVTNFSSTSCVQVVFLNNTSGSTQTCTMTDNQGTPAAYVSSFQIPGNSNILLSFGGIKFLSGVKWSCTNANQVNGQVLGYQ